MNKEIRSDRVAIYIRWSTEDQGEGTTLAVQSEACRHYVQSQGWQVREDLIFIDEGFSGGSLERPAMNRLRKMIQQGLVDCVVVFKLDRLSRSVIDTVTLVLQEWEDLTYLKSAREPVDTTTAMGKQFFYMLVSYAEWERNVIRERMFGGKLRRAKEGRSPGFPMPYGYKKGPTPGTLEVIEEQAQVVRLVYNMAEEGTSVRQITLHLNKNGFASRKGAPWGTSMVSKMLHNPAYTGKLVWGRRRANPRHGKAPGETKLKMADPHVVIEQSVIPAIVDQAQFDRVQMIMAGNKKIAPRAVGSEYLLTGLIKCGKCGRFMQYNGYQGWNYYRCGGKTGQQICDAPSIPAEALEDQILHLLRERYGASVVSEVETSGLSRIEAELEQLQMASSSVGQALERLEGQEKVINRDYRLEQITAEERRQLLTEVLEEKQTLLRQQSDLAQRDEDLRTRGLMMAQQARILSDEDAWSKIPMGERKQVLRIFIDQIKALRESKDHIVADVVWSDEPACQSPS